MEIPNDIFTHRVVTVHNALSDNGWWAVHPDKEEEVLAEILLLGSELIYINPAYNSKYLYRVTVNAPHISIMSNVALKGKDGLFEVYLPYYVSLTCKEILPYDAYIGGEDQILPFGFPHVG